MYEILINLSRYVFLIYILSFLLLGFFVAIFERKISKFNNAPYILAQRIIIILFNITSFLILSFNNETNNFEKSTLFMLVISTIFILSSNFIVIKTHKKSCGILWNSIFFLISIGIVTIYRLNPYLAYKQIIWLGLGSLLAILTPFILNILPKLDYFKYIYLILGLTLLVCTLLFGIEKGGAKNWISIKGFTFQPSEIVKILFIFYLASCFSKQDIKLRNLIFPSLMSCIFVLFLVFQTDLGSALIFFITYLIMLYISTSKTWLVIFCVFLASLSSNFAYKYFYHVKVRIDIWKNPFEDITDKGWQIVQSLFAIGTYGLLGSGLNKGMPNYIPVVEQDFIFSAICEEFGVLFGICLILIFIMIFFRGVKIALKTNNRFLSLIASGITSLLCFQSFLIIGGVTKFIPLTGVTLPFISYGGSSIIISFLIIGIIQWISIKNTNYLESLEILNEG